MSAFADRFVGCDCLPGRLSEFDREHFFTLTKADVDALKDQFREGHQLAAVLVVLFMRVAGRSLDGFRVIPRNLLRYAAGTLGVAAPSIASLRSIYGRGLTWGVGVASTPTRKQDPKRPHGLVRTGQRLSLGGACSLTLLRLVLPPLLEDNRKRA